MKFVYVSSDIGIHVEAISDELYQRLGDNFVFISTIEPGLDGGIHKYAEMGRDYLSKPYRLCAWESIEKEKEALMLIDDADVVFGGGFPFNYIVNRIKNHKLTFYSSERWFKRPFPFVSLKGWISIYKTLIKNQNDNFRFLALGAYCANDADLLRVFKDKIYHFAYLVPIDKYDVKEVVERKFSGKIRIMWCARFLDWKHPELVVNLARTLLNNHFNEFVITMVGDINPIQIAIKKKVETMHMGDYFRFIDGLPNNEIREMMKESDVFLITSDRREGWGVVLNEAMGSGCAIVASNQVGAVPVLLKHGQNGLIFKSKSVESLYNNVQKLIDNREIGKRLAYNAYKTITEEWSAANVASRFIRLTQSILDDQEIVYKTGPCSLARPCDTRIYD